MRRALTVLCAGSALALCDPAAAATLSVSGGVLEFNATGGRRNVVNFTQVAAGTVRVAREVIAGGDEDGITSASGCTANTVAVIYTCTGITSVVVNAGDGDDRISAAGLQAIRATLRGGPGHDVLTAGEQDDLLEGGAGDDTLTGGPGNGTLRGGPGDDLLYGGDGDEVLDGGEDNDRLQGNGGADVLRGGPGSDTTYHAHGNAETVTVTLDGAPGDGATGENDHVEADVEHVVAGSEAPDGGPGAVRIVGNAGANQLEVLKGNATIVGGAGLDQLLGGPHDDSIDAVDGGPDRVVCGAGTDTVLADEADDVAPDCEHVQRVAAPVEAPAPAPAPKPKPKPAVRQFKLKFGIQPANRGPTVGRLVEARLFRYLRKGSKVTLRCTRGCSGEFVTRAEGGRARVRLRDGLRLLRGTRVELRVARRGERTRFKRYRFERRGSTVKVVLVKRGVFR